MESRRYAPWSWTILVVLAALAAQGLALFNPDFVTVDCEERFNAAHGLALAQGHWADLFSLQYRSFCGGCTFEAALAGVLFSFLPATFGVWKLVPLLFTAAIAVVGFRGLWRLTGPLSATLFVGFLVLAPGLWVRLALLGWGNHYEAGLFCLAFAFFAVRPPSDRAHLGVGLLAGFALWFGFSSTYAVLGLVGWLVARRRFGALRMFGVGLMLAPVLWGVQYVTSHRHPFVTIYTPRESIPTLQRIPSNLMTLVLPRQLAALFALPHRMLGIPIGVGALCSILVASVAALRQTVRKRTGVGAAGVIVCILATWLVLYLVLDFRLELHETRFASAFELRYAAPWMPMLWAFLSVTAAEWWRSGRRLQASALLLPFLVSGILTKVAVVGGAFPNTFVFSLDAIDHDYHTLYHASALDLETDRECKGTDPDHRAAHAYAAGRHAAVGLVDDSGSIGSLPEVIAPADAFYAGLGQVLLDQTDSSSVGGLAVLEDFVDTVRMLPSDGQSPALEQATWWRAYEDEPFGFARGPVGSAPPLKRLLDATRSVDPDLRDRALESLGRRWGLTMGRWGQVGAVHFPAIRVRPGERAGLTAFAEGFGHGLGTKWGPASVVPRPTGMPAFLDSAFLFGVQRGVASQWVYSPKPVLSDVSSAGAAWTDVGAGRWWGPAPTMGCHCRAVCW